VRANQAEGREDDAELSAEKALSAENAAWLEQPDVQRALKIVREAALMKPHSINPTHSLELDLGLDSMQRIELLVAIERAIGGDVEESQLSEIYTVRELIDAVRESAANRQGGRRITEVAGWKAILQEDPAEPDSRDLFRPAPFKETFWYIVSRLMQIIASDRFHLQVSGLEKLPNHGPFIICSNHQSYLDPIVLGSVLPWQIFRDSFAVGTSEIFGKGFLRTLARWLRVVVLDPDANLIPAMRAGSYGLRHGGVLMLYPEGERSIDGKPKTFKKGAAILSIHLQVPLVPVAIEGFYQAWPRGKPFQKFAPLQIKFGNAIYPPVEAKASEAAYQELTEVLKKEVVTMQQQLQNSRSVET
jgi:long-chain acyl-CoA synthetase